MQDEKCVMVIDETLPLGIIVNTATILGITLGKQMPNIVNVDVNDHTGKTHMGITEVPVPILKGNIELVRSLREKLFLQEYSNLIVVDFTEQAQRCKTYDEYIDIMSKTEESELHYLGIAIYGNKKQINKLTGSLPLLR